MCIALSMASEKEKMAAAETKSPSNKSNCTSPGKKGEYSIILPSIMLATYIVDFIYISTY